MSTTIHIPTTSRRDFWIYWVGQTISNLGSSFTIFALPLLVYQLTRSALNLGITTATTFVPYLLFGLVIGAWVDRLDRRRLMIVTDLLRALVIASIPALAAFHALRVEWVYAVAFINSTLTIFFSAAEFAAIPSLVSAADLVSANGRIQASFSAASIAGPILAGLLLTHLPLATVLYVDAASFVISSISLALIQTGFSATKRMEGRQHILRDVAEGLSYVFKHPVLRNISIMMALINVVSNAAYPQLILFAKRQLAASDAQVALLYGAFSAGIVVFSLLASPLRRRLPFGIVALGGLMLSGLSLAALAFQRDYPVAVAIWAFGAVAILLDINAVSLRQAIVPNHLLGRMSSIANVLAWSAIPLGALTGGFVVERTGNIVLLFAVAGALMFLLALGFALFSPLGRAERYIPTAVAADTTSAVPAAGPGELADDGDMTRLT